MYEENGVRQLTDNNILSGKAMLARQEKAIEEFKKDDVNHPEHYKSGGIETIDFIEAKELNFRLGNAVKYISRAGKKDPQKRRQDLEKAMWYLKREIEKC